MQVQDTDLKLLRIFETIVRCGGFAAAQPILNIGASSISEYMSQLETRLGLRLCERGRAGFRLTEEGAELHAAGAGRQVDDAPAPATDGRPRVRFRCSASFP